MHNCLIYKERWLKTRKKRALRGDLHEFTEKFGRKFAKYISEQNIFGKKNFTEYNKTYILGFISRG